MNIAIIDADLIGRKKHRFPNLCSLKIGGYYKNKGHTVCLKTDYEDLQQYDKVFISKVFEDTKIDHDILNLPNVEYGGTGFYYDKVPDLPYEIEHHMPDYHLYDEWVNSMIEQGKDRKEFEYYLDHSIGFTTRGCFRKCSFCVNKKYDKVILHSPVEEFLDKTRKYICLLDDNILAYGQWEQIFDSLIATKKYFQYKQGMDIRLMTDKKAEKLSKCKYRGDYIFAFDHIKDRELIEKNLALWRKYCKSKSTKLYVLCGYDENEHSEREYIRNTAYNEEFWTQDIIDTFERIKILMRYQCLPYIMRFNKYERNPFKSTYINFARWCNQPNFFKKKSYREYCQANQDRTKNGICSAIRYLNELEEVHPEIANKYFDLKYSSFK